MGRSEVYLSEDCIRGEIQISSFDISRFPWQQSLPSVTRQRRSSAKPTPSNQEVVSSWNLFWQLLLRRSLICDTTKTCNVHGLESLCGCLQKILGAMVECSTPTKLPSKEMGFPKAITRKKEVINRGEALVLGSGPSAYLWLKWTASNPRYIENNHWTFQLGGQRNQRGYRCVVVDCDIENPVSA